VTVLAIQERAASVARRRERSAVIRDLVGQNAELLERLSR
jgi:hypothetical protein